MSDKVNANRKNFLMRVIAAQEIYLNEKKHEGITDVWIWRNKIYPVYFISKTTFNKWMGINAKRELTEILEAQKHKVAPAIAGILLACMCLFGACTSPMALQDAAIRQYPVRDSVVVRHDTLWYEIDVPPYEVTVHDTVPCPPHLTDTLLVYRTRTITRAGDTVSVAVPVTDSTVWRRYTAVEAQLQDALRACERYKQKAQGRHNWFYAFVIAALLFLLSSALHLVRKR